MEQGIVETGLSAMRLKLHPVDPSYCAEPLDVDEARWLLADRDRWEQKAWQIDVDRNQVVRRLEVALKAVIAAYRWPEECAHDEEPDYCDACRYQMEKAMGLAMLDAAHALKNVWTNPAPTEGTEP